VTTLSESDLAQQIRVGLTTLSILRGRDEAPLWHPTVAMWSNYQIVLAKYTLRLLSEWRDQGFRDNTRVLERLEDMGFPPRVVNRSEQELPWWWNSKAYHRSQRAAMLRSDKDWYCRIFSKSDPLTPWLYPTDVEGEFLYGPAQPWDGHDPLELVGRPMFLDVRQMTDAQFVDHINNYHQLLGNNKPIKMKDAVIFDMLRAFHDRFHSQRVYNSHDHIR
jgi:Pyrimidine dimer DNA glycosylase